MGRVGAEVAIKNRLFGTWVENRLIPQCRVRFSKGRIDGGRLGKVIGDRSLQRKARLHFLESTFEFRGFHRRRGTEEVHQIAHDFGLPLPQFTGEAVLHDRVSFAQFALLFLGVLVVGAETCHLGPHFQSVLGNHVIVEIDPDQLIVGLPESGHLFALVPTGLFKNRQQIFCSGIRKGSQFLKDQQSLGIVRGRSRRRGRGRDWPRVSLACEAPDRLAMGRVRRLGDWRNSRAGILDGSPVSGIPQEEERQPGSVYESERQCGCNAGASKHERGVGYFTSVNARR